MFKFCDATWICAELALATLNSPIVLHGTGQQDCYKFADAPRAASVPVRGIPEAVGPHDRDVGSAPKSGLGHASQNVVYTILAKIIGTYVLSLKMVWDVILRLSMGLTLPEGSE